MGFDYDRDTRHHYQSHRVASEYHSGFAGRLTREAVAHRVVAWRERRVVGAYLARVPCTRILDAPCGTGKLAEVVGRAAKDVVAADISPDMLEFARAEYMRAGVDHVQFQVLDLAEAQAAELGVFDVVVSLRLMHRVPPALQKRMLEAIAACSRRAVVSFGIETAYHQARRHLRASILGGDASPLCYESLDAVLRRVAVEFDVLDRRWIFPMGSQEMILLLRSRRFR